MDAEKSGNHRNSPRRLVRLQALEKGALLRRLAQPPKLNLPKQRRQLSNLSQSFATQGLKKQDSKKADLSSSLLKSLKP